MMLDRGTTTEDKFAIARKLEDVGASISFGVDTQVVDIRARCLARDLPMVIGLIAEQLRAPAISPEELERARQQFIGALRGSKDDSSYRVRDAFNRTVFPPGHPNHPQTLESLIKSAQSATVADIKAFHQKNYGPSNLILVFVGDVEAQHVKREITQSFAGWTGGAGVLQAREPAKPAPASTETVELEQKPSVTILLGQATGLRYRDPDCLALRVGASVLGAGFTSRLMSSVRDHEGLTYGIGAGLGDDAFTDGAFFVSATFAPQLLDRGLASTQRELRKWWAQGITPEELRDHQQNLIGLYQVGLSTSGGLAGALLMTAQRGLDLGWLDRYPSLIRALTPELVNAAVKKHLDPDKMILVQVGTLAAGRRQP
jgi:zinc protease